MTDNNKSIMYPFSIILFMFGFNINVNNTNNSCIKKLFQYTFKLIIIIIVSYFTHRRIAILTSYHDKFYQTLFPLATFIKVLTVLLSLICIELKFFKIKKLITIISAVLNENDKRSMILAAKLITIVWFIIVTIYVVIVYTCFNYTQPVKIIMIFMWICVIFGWNIAIIIFLIHICYAVYLIEKRLLIKPINNITGLDKLEQDILLTINIKNKINDVLGIFPFIWFCELFTTTCFMLTQTCISNYKHYLYRGLLDYSLIALLKIIYVLILNYFQTLRPTTDEFIACYGKPYSQITSIELIKRNSIFDIFETYTKCHYMAYNAFAIDIKFLFAFIGSGITFTVMLIQLLNH